MQQQLHTSNTWPTRTRRRTASTIRQSEKKLFWKKRNPLLQGSIQTPMKARMVKWVLEYIFCLHTIYQQKRVHDNKDEENLMMAHKFCDEVLLVKLERRK
jgi:hypothetical protein